MGEVLDLLSQATLDLAKLRGAIEALQTMVWKSRDWERGLAESVTEVLSTLAYDLDYYEPDSSARAEDYSYFGEARAIEEIRTALAKLREPPPLGSAESAV